ncbi:unnamed protein product, partial [Choristocarpus tenellus]
ELLQKVQCVLEGLDDIEHDLAEIEEEAKMLLDSVGGTMEGPDGEESKDGKRDRGGLVSNYYHFSSDGKKLPSKWDTYNVEDELARLEEEEEEENQREKRQFPSNSVDSRRKSKALLRRLGGLSSDLDSALGFLDQVRGDEVVKKSRGVEVR